LSGELFQAAGSGEVTAARRCKARGSDVFGDVFGDVLGDFLGRCLGAPPHLQLMLLNLFRRFD
jgi:hypothetical protein